MGHRSIRLQFPPSVYGEQTCRLTGAAHDALDRVPGDVCGRLACCHQTERERALPARHTTLARRSTSADRPWVDDAFAAALSTMDDRRISGPAALPRPAGFRRLARMPQRSTRNLD